jgi:uncharacterized repeat protein (TIGR03803 family)
VFELTTSGVFTPIYTFTNGQDGGFPASGLTLGTDGNLYGESFAGGAKDSGVLFKITLQGALTVLHQFTSDVDGSGPIGGLVQGTNGDFYGTTSRDGNPEISFPTLGTIFQVTPVGQ